MASSGRSPMSRIARRSQRLCSLIGSTEAHESPTLEEEEGESIDVTDPVMKKRLQNRLAQRAYRMYHPLKLAWKHTLTIAMLGKRVKSRLDKLDVLQKQFHQLKQRKQATYGVDAISMQTNRQRLLERSLSPLNTANEPHVYAHASPSTDDETGMHQILGLTHPLTDTPSSQAISGETRRNDLYQQALSSYFSTLPDCHSVSTSRDTGLAPLSPFAPTQLGPNGLSHVDSQTAVYFSDPWISNAHNTNATTIQLSTDTDTTMDTAIGVAIEPHFRDADKSGKDSNQNTIETCSQKGPPPTMDMEIQPYPAIDSPQADGTQNTEVDLQRLGSLHVIMDTIQATAFASFDELVVYYYTAELSRSARLAHEQHMSRSQRLSGVLRDLVSR